jgi:hypothetical protein
MKRERSIAIHTRFLNIHNSTHYNIETNRETNVFDGAIIYRNESVTYLSSSNSSLKISETLLFLEYSEIPIFCFSKIFSIGPDSRDMITLLYTDNEA